MAKRFADLYTFQFSNRRKPKPSPVSPEPMDIRYIHHARKQMAKRRITEEDVELALADPDETYPGNPTSRTCFVKHIGEKKVKIVVEPIRSDGHRVITVIDQNVKD